MSSTKLMLDPNVLKQRLSINWVVVVFPLGMFLWVLVSSLVPQVHRLVCRRDPAEGREVMASAFKAVEAATQRRVYWSVFRDTPDEEFSAQITLAGWMAATDSLATVPSIDSTVAWFDCTAYEKFGAIDLRYVLRSTLTPDGKGEDAAKTRALPAGHAPHWTVRYAPPGTVEGNQAAIHSFLERIANASPQGGQALTLDSLAASTRWWSFEHERRTQHFSERWPQVRLGVGALAFLLFAPLFIRQVIQVDRFCSARRRVYTQRGVSVLPHSRWCLFWAWSLSQFVLTYEEHCRRLQREHGKAARLRQRNERNEQRDRKQAEDLEDALQAFLDRLPTTRLSTGVEAAIAIATDSDEGLPLRRSALERARHLLRASASSTVESDCEQPVVLSLDERVAKATVAAKTLSQTAFKRFHQHLNAGNAADNPATRTYWLERAIRVANGEELVAEPVRNGHTAIETAEATEPKTTVETVLTMEGLKQRLAIQGFLPAEYSLEHVEEIVFELLQPTKRGQAAFMSRLQTGKYRRPEPMLRHIRSRLGAEFSQDQYDGALDWLLHESVLLRKRKSHDYNLALNAIPSDATPLGRPIVERIVGFYQWVQRELTR